MRPHTPSPSRSGFTLIELMVVLAVIAVVAGLAAPAISQALNQRRTNQAALDLVRLVRNARSSAAAYGRAHLVRYTSGGLGRVDVFRGINNRCNTNDWATLMAGGCDGNSYCIDYLDPTDGRYQAGSFDILMQSTNFGGGVDVCYEPTGVTQWRTAAANPFVDLNSAQVGGGFRFTFTPRIDGTQEGVVRQVVLPLGGDARLIR